MEHIVVTFICTKNTHDKDRGKEEKGYIYMNDVRQIKLKEKNVLLVTLDAVSGWLCGLLMNKAFFYIFK